MIDDLDELVTAAVTSVFGTMLDLSIVSSLVAELPAAGVPHVAGCVGFIGRLSGVVYLHTTDSFARRITAHLLRLSAEEIDGDEMVNDAVGEITNMVVGHLKSRLVDRGLPCVQTIPSVVRGTSLRVEPVSSTQGRLLSFVCQQDRLLAEILIQPGA